MRYSVDPAEKIRKQLSMTAREFSVRIGYDPQSYEIALERGYMTRRMAKEVARRWKIPWGDFLLDGEKR